MSIEAMKLALEALEYASARIETVNFDFEPEITALRQAIKQAQKQEPVGDAYLCDACHTPFDGAYECPSCGHNEATKEPVYVAPPQRQPEQEPLQGAVNLKGVVTHVELGQEDDFCREFGATRIYAAPQQHNSLKDVHRESGMTSDELWLSNGKLRSEMADLKVQLKQSREDERQVCADELMAFANRHRNLHSTGMTDLDHCVVYTLETNAYLLRTRFYENHAPKEAKLKEKNT